MKYIIRTYDSCDGRQVDYNQYTEARWALYHALNIFFGGDWATVEIVVHDEQKHVNATRRYYFTGC
jgi:hypothetical protein